MDLSTITMERNEARQKFLEYRHAVRERHDQEDEAIMRGYRALSRGQQVIHLSDTIKAGGLDDEGLPKLAVMQADLVWCHLRVSSTDVVFSDDNDNWRQRHRRRFRFGVDLFDPQPTEAWHRQAMVPIVPPALRPADKLGNYHVLWEVPKWEKVPRPPGDPALLKRIGGDLFAVVAIWDLTPLEQAVLSGRRP